MKCMQKFAGLAVLGVAGVCGSAGATWLMQSEPVQAQEGDKDVLTAREFHLVDDKGVPRMMFDIGDDGSARITMMDANLKPRLQLGVDGEQASCAFLDDKGTPRYVVAHRNKDNNVLITFADAKGTPRLLQSLTDDG
ncbi:MAG: hypothetical protein IT463_11375, partial [Planctomycetes bacterium]|nr:hypothetical protein [Planctomycetota bacterium]